MGQSTYMLNKFSFDDNELEVHSYCIALFCLSVLIHLLLFYLQSKEELFMYRGSKKSEEEKERQKETKRFSFSIKDSLKNIGPIRDLAIGESQDYASISNTHSSVVKKPLDLVTASGFHKNGSLCVLQVLLFHSRKSR